MSNKISRRSVLKSLGVLPFGLALGSSDVFAKYTVTEKKLEYKSLFRTTDKPSKKITVIVIGAGNRGKIYGGYAVDHPDELDIIGVAEPIEIRRARYSEKHNIEKQNQFTTWEDVFKVKKFADAVFITTPDYMHYGPAMKALEMGYDVLLEKPIAQTWEECKAILKMAKKHNNIVAICHVLRYAPYYVKIKEVIDSGILGRIVSVQHMEPIVQEHMAHSFVRGNWRNTEVAAPILLAKSCHDLDILRWWLAKKCTAVSSFGALTHFKKENAPVGSTNRCTDGCAVESTCPYSALRIYYRKRSYLHHFDLPTDAAMQGDAIMQNLKEGPYGRCVYHCDNNVLDHQVVSMQFEDEITANFNLEAFTHIGGRKTRIMGTMGMIDGDGSVMEIANFKTEEIVKWNVDDHYKNLSGHGGGDMALMKDFVMAIDKKDPSLLTSTLEVSMDSHYMGYMAESARVKKEIVNL